MSEKTYILKVPDELTAFNAEKALRGEVELSYIGLGDVHSAVLVVAQSYHADILAVGVKVPDHIFKEATDKGIKIYNYPNVDTMKSQLIQGTLV